MFYVSEVAVHHDQKTSLGEERLLQKEREGNILAKHVILLLGECERHNIWFTVENPHNSRLFDLPEIRVIDKRWEKNTAVLDQCCFGLCDPVSKLAFRKRTRIIGSLPLLNSLSCRCGNTHVHQHVEGSVVWEGCSLKRSTLASEYPAPLCASLANLVHLAQSSGSLWRRSRVEAASVNA